MDAGGKSGRRRARRLSAASALACLLALACWAAPAALGDADLCPPGGGPGQCSAPRGMALDEAEGLLYVADRDNHRVNVFGEAGAFVRSFGIEGAGPGQLKSPLDVAVEEGSHDVYVMDRGNFRVQRLGPEGEFVWTVGKGVDKTEGDDLCTAKEIEEGHVCGAGEASQAEGGFYSDIASRISIDVGPGGVLHVLDNLHPAPLFPWEHRLQRFEPNGEEIAPQQILYVSAPNPSTSAGSASDLAIDPTNGDVWVAGFNVAPRKYDPAGAFLFELEDEGVSTPFLATDAEGRLFAVQGDGVGFVVGAYEATGQILVRYAYGRIPSKPEGIAVGPAGVFLSPGGAVGVRRLDFPLLPLATPGPILDPTTLSVEPKSARADVTLEVNPEGEATEVRFAYLTEAEYQEAGESFAGAKETAPFALGVEKFRLGEAQGTIGCLEATKQKIEEGVCLTPETDYRFLAIATNPDNPEGTGEARAEGQLTTKKPLEIEAVFTEAVGTDSARLGAEVDPLGIPATGYFEYVGEAEFQSDIEEGGDGFAAAARLPATDAEPPEEELPLGAAEGTVVSGAVAHPLSEGTTYRYRLAATNPLIDSYLRSDEGEAEPGSFTVFEAADPDPCPANAAFRIGAGALLPDCRAYELVSPLEKGGSDIRVLNSLSREPAVLEQSAESGERLAYGSTRAFGDAVSAPWTSQYIAQREKDEWVSHAISPERGEKIVGFPTDTEFKFFSPELCRAWLTTYSELPVPPPGYVPGQSNLLRRGDRLCGAEGLEALGPLEVPATPLLMEVQGVSADGSHAIFTSSAKLAGAGPGQLIESHETPEGPALRGVCILPGGAKWGGGCTAGARTGFGETRGVSVSGALSGDGERVYWTDKGEGAGKIYLREGGTETLAVSPGPAIFWGASTDDGERAIFIEAGTLYEYSAAEEEARALGGGAVGVLGMGEGARRVYFASEALLTGEEPGEANSEGDFPIEGEPNLYLYEAGAEWGEGEIVFLGTLAGADVIPPLTFDDGAVAPEPSHRSARVSADGQRAAFASYAPLTAYDGVQTATGEQARQIYLYDALAGQLRCVSCNPSGARPAGPASIAGYQNHMHASRELSADGRRLFFESADALVPRDSNGAVDVYQWEQAGKGGCEQSDPEFSATAEGCLSLISSGQSPLDARFVEADPEGENAFFATLAGLLPHDYGLIDIYDARVGGGLPFPDPPTPPCEGDACAPQIAPPEPLEPASEAFQGRGESNRARRCRGPPARARRLARRAKRMRRAAARAPRRAAARRLRRAAARAARGARSQRAAARRCRAAARRARR